MVVDAAQAQADSAERAAAARIPFLVVNPRSGNGATGRRWPRLLEDVRESFGEVECALTSRPMEAAELARAALQAGHRTIFAVGGDGTLNEVLNGFFGADGQPVAPDAVIGLLPQGTGGDFKRTAGIPGDWLRALRHVAAARPRRVDVGRLRFRAHDGREATRYFLNIASFGVSGAVDEAVNRSSKWLGGKASFMFGSFRAMLGHRDRRVRFSVDGGPEEEAPVTVLAVSNGQFFGGGMWVSPAARLDDGQFSCTLWSGYGLRDFVLRGRAIYSGRHVQWPGTRCFSARRLRATSDERVLLDVDGEQPGTLPAEFEILPGAIGLKA